jgi:transcriptional regulator with XRE-family HTH domain
MTLTSPSDLGATRHLMVSQRLRERRRTLGLTQKQVISRLARLGVLSTNKALSSLEHGSGLDVAKLPELAAALDCSVTWLLGLNDDPHSWEPVAPRAGSRTRTADADMIAFAGSSNVVASSSARPQPRILGPLSGSE